ncbi:MAG: AraC family transcriptional regulator [Chloroflexota bacterium]
MPQPMRQEHVKFWLDPDLGHLELLHATYITHTFVPHAHTGFAIGVIESGGQAVTCQRLHTLIMPAGSIAVINPGVVHDGRAVGAHGWTYRMLYPATHVLQQAATHLTGRVCDTPFFPHPVIHDDMLAQQIRRLHSLLEDPTTSSLERESRLLWTLAHLIARHADTVPTIATVGSEPSYVKTIQAYLIEHFAENITLEQLATLVNLSPFHLLRAFRNTVGLPPHAYMLQVRVEQAKKLLQTGMSIADVAVQTGFADQSHLTRQFKRTVGVTPGQYCTILT